MKSYHRVTLSRVAGVSALLFLLLVAASLVALGTGAVQTGFLEMLQALRDYPGGGAENQILFSVRLPRILFAGAVGASLSMAGVVFQALLRNPLADPYVLGISGGSALGAIAGIISGAGAFFAGVPLLAFSGAIVTVVLVFVVAGGPRGVFMDNSLLLAGVVVNSFFSAAILFCLSVVDSMELRSISFWLMGDLSGAAWPDIGVVFLCLLVAFVVLYSQARKLNLLVQGQETASQLGVNIKSAKYIMLTAASLLTAMAVSLAGIIGFVGMMVPHMMRLVWGADHRLLLPAAALFGALLLIAADTLARTVLAPAELPVGVITALCGAPYFIFLMRTRGGR